MFRICDWFTGAEAGTIRDWGWWVTMGRSRGGTTWEQGQGVLLVNGSQGFQNLEAEQYHGEEKKQKQHNLDPGQGVPLFYESHGQGSQELDVEQYHGEGQRHHHLDPGQEGPQDHVELHCCV